MVDEESTAITAKKHLIRHTHNARMTPSPTGEGLFILQNVHGFANTVNMKY